MEAMRNTFGRSSCIILICHALACGLRLVCHVCRLVCRDAMIHRSFQLSARLPRLAALRFCGTRRQHGQQTARELLRKGGTHHSHGSSRPRRAACHAAQ